MSSAASNAQTRRASGWVLLSGVARGFALCFGGFALLNLAGEWRYRDFDSNHWWITVRVVPHWLSFLLLAVGGAFMLAWCLRPRCRSWRRYLTAITVATFCMLTAADAVGFYRLW